MTQITPETSCAWHKGDDDPLDLDEFWPGCQGCGNMYAVKDCEGCGQTFIDWTAKGFDDCISGPYVTASGDLYCTRCGPREDEQQEQLEDEEAEEFGGWGWDPYATMEES